MHPVTLNAYQSALAAGLRRDDAVMRILAGPHHFHVSRPIYDCAVKIMTHEGTRTGADNPFFMPFDSRLPADELIMTIDGAKRPFVLCRLPGYRDHEVAFGTFIQNQIHWIGTWAPGRDEMFDLRKQGSPVPVEDVQSLCGRFAFILSLMNQPRLVEMSSAPKHECSRQHLRHVERLTQRPALAFTRVSWTIGKPVKSKNGKPVAEDDKRPLHWARAYWAFAKEGEPKAEWANFPSKGGWGWYRWVADSWRGHPRYGLKLQDHAPRLDGERGRTKPAPFAILNATKAAALTDVQRNTLAAAGYLPTAVLQ